MRILFVNNLRGYYGGVEQVVEDYARGLTRRGHECILAYGKDGRDPEVYGASFVETYVSTQFGCGDQGYSFSEIIGAVSPDVVFVHKVEHLPPGLEDNRSFRKVLMVHDHDLWCPKGTGYYTRNRHTCQVAAGLSCYLDGAFLERCEGGLLPVKLRSIRAKIKEMRRSHHFDTILVLSEYLKRQLIINGFPSERIRINNPVVDQGAPEPRPLPKAPKVLFVGSLIRGKGVDLLLHALAMVSCPFQLDIVGTGKSEGELRVLASKLGLSDCVNFVGWVSHDDVPRYYHEAQVVAIPSCWPEPFGLIGQEAMRCARPVVAFDVGGIPDWCDDGNTGFIIPEQDITAFSAALERLLSDFELAQEMGRNGLRKVESQFSFEKNLDKVESYLRCDTQSAERRQLS
ncbi:MAG: glycosyltransferase family 4 protein [Sedimenticola sp.]